MLGGRPARPRLRGPVSPPLLARAVLALGALMIIGAFVLDMSGSAARTAGSNRFRPLVFSVFPRGGQTACQPIEGLPYDAGRVSVLIGTYGRPLPPVSVAFRDSAQEVTALAESPGGRQGYVVMPVRRLTGRPATTVCLHIGGRAKVAIGGVPAPAGPGAAVIAGKPQSGDMTVFYFRRSSETWWRLLPVLEERLAWGKAPFFGDWTLPAIAALALVVLLGAAALAAREFR